MLDQLKRLVGHSGIYGVGLLVQALVAVLLLPVYTRYLSEADYGAVETVVAGTFAIGIVLRGGISTAFFRFYLAAEGPERRLTVVRTSFWFTMTAGTVGLVGGLALAQPLSRLIFGSDQWTNLIRAGAVLLWADVNYAQLAALFRVEQRAAQFVVASIANLAITVVATVLLVTVALAGPTGVVVGNFTGTLVVYVALLAYQRDQLGLEFDRPLLRAMQRFGWPLVPSGLALWTVNFIDRFFLVRISGQSETGVYSIAVRISTVVGLALGAFQAAWPAFAYSMDDDRRSRETFGYVLTYLLFVACWLSLALGLLAPWIVRLVAPSSPGFWPGERAVGLLAFGVAALAGYSVVSTATSRIGRTQFNWVVTGGAALINVALNVALIPSYGLMGAAVATLAAFTAMFAAMAVYSQRLYPVPYQWRRVVLIAVVSGGLLAAGKAVHPTLALAIALSVIFPLVLAPLGFYEAAEWRVLRRAVAIRR
jgi:O-antigen/teichoic acid export membrane protein